MNKIIGIIANVGGIAMIVIGLLTILELWHTQIHPVAFIVLGIPFALAGYTVIKIQDDDLQPI